MALSAGIVGLPNVGKSSFFNTITKLSILVENYPFATIEPNVGVVNLADERLDQLVELIQPEKITPATFKFVDIAGLVKGASKGEGLGNKFLQNIKDVDAIIHVVRCFDDKDVLSTTGVVDAATDAQIIDLEMIYADLDHIKNALNRLPKKMGSKLTHQVDPHDLLSRIKSWLESDRPLRLMSFDDHEQLFLKSYNFLTLKPMLYLGNVNDEDVSHPEQNVHFQNLKKYADEHQSLAIALSVRLESELAQLPLAEAKEMMDEFQINTSGLNRMIHTSFQLLNLATYFTYGKKEVRAWPFRKGSKAPVCAGIIHSDMEKGFIRVEVMKHADLIALKSEAAVKQGGKLLSEGKDYVVGDGDICYFKFNV